MHCYWVGSVNVPDDQTYRHVLVPIISGGKKASGIVRGCSLVGEYTRRVTRGYMMGRETAPVLVGQGVGFKVEVDCERLGGTEALVRVRRVAQLRVWIRIHSDRGM